MNKNAKITLKNLVSTSIKETLNELKLSVVSSKGEEKADNKDEKNLNLAQAWVEGDLTIQYDDSLAAGTPVNYVVYENGEEKFYKATAGTHTITHSTRQIGTLTIGEDGNLASFEPITEPGVDLDENTTTEAVAELSKKFKLKKVKLQEDEQAPNPVENMPEDDMAKYMIDTLKSMINLEEDGTVTVKATISGGAVTAWEAVEMPTQEEMTTEMKKQIEPVKKEIELKDAKIKELEAKLESVNKSVTPPDINADGKEGNEEDDQYMALMKAKVEVARKNFTHPHLLNGESDDK